MGRRWGAAGAVLLAVTGMLTVAGCASTALEGFQGDGAGTAPATQVAAAPVAEISVALPSGVNVAPASAMEALIDSMEGATCKDDPDAAAVAAVPENERTPLSPDLVPPAAGEPRLWVEELAAAQGGLVDVGPIPRDAPSDHRFTVVNAGTAELTISAVTASCGCTRVEVETQVLAPGEQTYLHVTYDPEAAEEKTNQVEKYVRLRSNDPARPLAEFTFAGTLAP